MSEYELRMYNPGLGRWLSRDPIEENGGISLYGFLDNIPTHRVDKDGQMPVYWGPGFPYPALPGDPHVVPDKKKWKFPKPKMDCGGLVTPCCSRSDCMLDVHERGDNCRKDGASGCFYFCALACTVSSGGYIGCLSVCWSYCEASMLLGCSAGEAVCVGLCTTCPQL